MLVLDFDGVLTTNQVFVSEYGHESVICSRLDGIGIRRVQQLGIRVAVLSSETNAVVSARCKKLGVECHQGHEDKLGVLKWLASDREIPLADVAYLGNDRNDLRCLSAVGHPYIVADAHESVQGYGFRRLQTCGGYGAVRELCDMIAEGRLEIKPRQRAWHEWLGLNAGWWT